MNLKSARIISRYLAHSHFLHLFYQEIELLFQVNHGALSFLPYLFSALQLYSILKTKYLSKCLSFLFYSLNSLSFFALRIKLSRSVSILTDGFSSQGFTISFSLSILQLSLLLSSMISSTCIKLISVLTQCYLDR